MGRDIIVCRRAHRVCTFEGHSDSITRLFVFGSNLLSVSAGGRVLAWDIGKDALDHLDGKRSGEEAQRSIFGFSFANFFANFFANPCPPPTSCDEG